MSVTDTTTPTEPIPLIARPGAEGGFWRLTTRLAEQLGWDVDGRGPITDRRTAVDVGHAAQKALRLAAAALEHAEQTCRFHGTNPPERTFGRGCASCLQPTRVREALAALTVFAPTGQEGGR